MYKLVINGIQIGNYKSVKNLMSCAFNMEVVKNGIESAKWTDDKTFWVKTKKY